MKNHPSVTIVAPNAPYSSEARLIRLGMYSWLIACMPVIVRATIAAPGSRAPGSLVVRGRIIKTTNHATR